MRTLLRLFAYYVGLGVLTAGLMVSVAVYSRAQSISPGGTFNPITDTIVGGQWTFRGSSPIKFEGNANTQLDDAYELTLAVPSPTADVTQTLQNATGTVTLQTGATITLTNVDLDTGDNSVAASICETQASVTATGVAATDNLIWTMTSSDLGLGFSVTAIIPTGANTVSIRVCNETAGALDPGAVADFRLVPIL